MTARNVFGGMAFLLTGMVIGLSLSPWVPDTKENAAMLVLGNVLAWPVIVLQFYFGSSKSSVDKTAALVKASEGPTGNPDDPVATAEVGSLPRPAFGEP